MLMLSVFVQNIQSSKHPNILLKFVLLHILFSYLLHTAGAAILRATDCKYQKYDDRSEISNFIFFHLKYTYGELFSKIM